ncbi:MAG: hypothetical protein IPJ31_12115 [Bacteroidetes bacterium]|nr:hypothetical protein [Bacteroidota bacterium]
MILKKVVILLSAFTILSSCNSLVVRVGNLANRMSENVDRNKQNFLAIPFEKVSYTKLQVKRFDEIPIHLINATNFSTLLSNAGNYFKYFVIYTVGCQGTPSELRYIQKSDSLYSDQVKFFLISSDNIAAYLIQMLQKKLFRSGFFYPTYIIDHTVKSFLDDRKRGEIFRNQVCEECRGDIIGVPYVMLFDHSNRLLFHGYRGYKTEIPADIIRYFISK